ncbi:MAG: T9SS type A sorting domain-containing protein [Rhodothermales bacterium]
MQTKGTDPYHFTHAIRAFACLGMLLLLLGTGREALAQNTRVQAEYQRLEAAAEQAKEMHAINPTATTLKMMNRAVDQFRQFGQVNRTALQGMTLDRGVAPAGTGGPDGFGYTYIDSNEPGGPAFSFINISGTGTLVAEGDDASSVNSGIFGPVTLGGPGFFFYGTTYTAMVPATNGYLSTDLADTGPDLSNDCPLPATPSTPGGTTAARLYPLHDDLVAGGGFGEPDGAIWWDYFASCPHPHSGVGCNVFHWNNANHFAGGGPFSFEAILFDDGDIIYQYEPGNPEQGSGSTTGIQSPAPSPEFGLTYETCNTFGSITDNLAILIESVIADVEVEKEVEIPDPNVKAGSYHVTVTNYGPDDVPDLEVTDTLPAALTVTGWTTTQGTFDPVTGLWDIGALASGASVELWIDVTFDAQGEYTNVAEITGGTYFDTDTSNDRDEASVLVLLDRVDPDFVSGLGPNQNVERDPFRFRADVSLTKTVDNEAPAVGTDITYTITVQNGGPQSTANVEATDHLPDCLDFVSATASQGSYDPATGVWTIDNLAVGQSVTLQITATVTADCSGEVVNTAEITGSSLPDPDHIFNIFEEPPVDDGIDSAAFTVSSAFARASSWLTGAELALGGAYPNPFNPEAVIPYALPESGYVRIRVYDMLGREVARLVDGEVSAGVHEVTLRAEALPTGVYLVRMEAQGQVQVQRVTLMK